MKKSRNIDWVTSTEPVLTAEDRAPSKYTMQDSRHELEAGLVVTELDTVPGELLELFK